MNKIKIMDRLNAGMSIFCIILVIYITMAITSFAGSNLSILTPNTEAEKIAVIFEDNTTVENLFNNINNSVYTSLYGTIKVSNGSSFVSILQDNKPFRVFVEGEEFCLSETELASNLKCSNSPWIGLSKKQLDFASENWDFIRDSINRGSGVIGYGDLALLMLKWTFW
jgi:hypothetical protein